MTTKAGKFSHLKSGLLSCLVHTLNILLICFLCPIAEYSLRSSKSKVMKCFSLLSVVFLN